MKRIATVFLLISFTAWGLTCEAKRNIYAVIVGVSDYVDDNLDLNYCDDDAIMFKEQLIKSKVPSQNIIMLLDSRATKEGILSSMRRLYSRATYDDEVIFYFSGHGAQGVFVPHDYTGYSGLLSHDDIKGVFKACKAYKKLCFADACFSGSIKGRKSGLETSNSEENRMYKSPDVAVLMSSRDSQTSREDPNLKNGVFTHYLIIGLKGEADENKDKTITITELYRYTSRKVRSRTDNGQIPVLFGSFDEQMPIVKFR